ncbi:MAG: ParA family protein [Myxococcota bacterium]|nr:ParA family protein [Myxococcota bacterium]
MAQSTVHCSVCNKDFLPRFSYQRDVKDDGRVIHYCSQLCRIPQLRAVKAGTPTKSTNLKECHSCGEKFEAKFAYQYLNVAGKDLLACSKLCRTALIQPTEKSVRIPRAIAVMNQKGGTAKTTTSVSVAAGLAERGFKTLLIDLDAQGNVGVSLGIRGPKSLYSVLVEGVRPEDVSVPVRNNLDVITADRSVAAAEIELVGKRDRARVLRRRGAGLIAPSSPYDFIIMDCAPSLSLLNQNALTFAREVLVPVSCDYLALVGVKQILTTLKHVNEVLLHPVQVLGVLPTFYDVRMRIAKEAMAALKAHFKERVLPPIRVNARLKEAPSHKRTIFEYAPDSYGAQDYAAAVNWILRSDKREIVQKKFAKSLVQTEATATVTA